MSHVQDNIIIPNQARLNQILKHIQEDGASQLHVLADFDKTITKAFVNGEYIPSMISVLRDGSYLTPDYASKSHALYDRYHPIELNPNIPLPEKKKAMEQWWVSHFELLLKSKLNISDLERVIQSNKIMLREGAQDFLDILHQKNIPLVIMSASGLGKDIIKLYLQKLNKLSDNIQIISNGFDWDNQGFAIGIKQPVVHSLNKDEILIKDSPIYDKVKNRTNVILLGDGLEDVDMVKGFSYENLLTIGFLNEQIEERLPHYKKTYDVLITNDSSMDFVNRVLADIC